MFMQQRAAHGDLMGAPIAELILNPPRVEPDRISANAMLITPSLGSKEVWIQMPERYGPYLATNADPFVLATLQRAMAEAELHGLRQLRVRGTVSPSLLDNLEQLQFIWERWSAIVRPAGVRYRRVDIEADEVAETVWPSEPSAAVAAFSGGVDSSFTIYRHVTGRAGRGSRDVRAAVLIHGMEIFLHEAASFHGAAERAHRMLDDLGIELIEISTNLRELSLVWEDDFGLYLGAVLTLLSGRFGFGLIASSYPYERLALPYGSTPLTDPLMSSATFRIVHDGAEYDRIEKAQLLGEWDAARQFLRFCWAGRDKSRNCGHCQKCITTLLSFRLAGVELNCFDVPVPDEDVHQVIRGMETAGLKLEAPQLLLRRADELSLEDDWVKWLRQRFERELKHPGFVSTSGSEASGGQRRPLVPLTTGGTRPPFFVVNAIATDASDFQLLASRLGSNQPFYALQPLLSAGTVPLRRTIESMARRCLREIRKVQTHGPFIIGGRSFGALVAYELAVRLESAGEKVALVAAIDSVGPLWCARQLANEVPYDPLMNSARVRAEVDGVEFGDVFSDPAAADAFIRWLRSPAFENDGPTVSRYLHAAYVQRPDLQKAFPVGEDGDGTAGAGLVQWAWDHGCSEIGMQPSLLPSSPAVSRHAPPTLDPRLRSRRRRAVERVLDWVNFATRGTLAPLAVRRRGEVLRIAGENVVRYRGPRLAASVLLIRPDKNTDGSPGALLDRWYGLDVGGLDEQVVAGSSSNILCEPAVASVAEYLDHRIGACLRTWEPGTPDAMSQ
jgi:hypothetical protein